MEMIAALDAVRLEATTKAGNANTGYSFVIAPTSTSVGLNAAAGRGCVRNRKSEREISENSAISIFARSTANITAGEHAAKARTTPVPAVTRPTSDANDRNIAVTSTTPMATVCDWSSPSAPSNSHGRRYISGRPHGSRGLIYKGS